MNSASKQIMTFIHFNVLIRDTLEFAMKKEKFDVNAFEHRKKGIRTELDNQTPLKVFLEKNGENGEKIRTKIEDLWNLVYADDNTICQVAGDGTELRVDSAQAVSLFESVIPVHEELTQIIDLHIKTAQQQQQAEQDIIDLMAIDERFYRGLVWFTLIPEIERQFIEFNKVMRESKGQPTPQSNFIQGDLQKLTNLVAFSRQHARVKDREYTDILDQVFDLLEELQGRRELRQGHKFETDFADVKRAVGQFVAKVEPQWKEKFEGQMQTFIKEVREMEAQKQQA